ncbi:MobA/MobL family protein [Paraburkholderia sp. BCC1885]|uniref:MobA/MobL family protein n=1 Tax=Paraburkholderia sp. BCC1885 TaxID=2562669 RepID=UPI00118362E0|nr:MobA/MobL family protein [Paraburkholderia sp. BCC1885]
MPLYHAHVKTFSRSKGDSAVAACAYRLGVALKDARTGLTHDYTKRKGVWGSFACVPDNAPMWAHDPGECWQKAEAAEKRKDACVAREFEFSLPRELTPEQNEILARDVAQHLVDRFGFAVTVGLHDFDTQPHAHVLATTRQIDAHGFGAKTRELDNRTSGAIEEVRAMIAVRTNEALAAAGHNTRVDHRSNAAQQIEAIARGDLARAAELDGKTAMVHEGKGPRARQRRARNRQVREQNAHRIQTLVTALETVASTEPTPTYEQAATSPQIASATAEHATNIHLGDQSMKPLPTDIQDVDFAANGSALFVFEDEPKVTRGNSPRYYTGLLTAQAYAWALQRYGDLAHVNSIDPSRAVLVFADSSIVTDHGRTLNASGGTPRDQAQRLCALALAKNWTTIAFTGSEDFLREAFEYALLHDLKIQARDDRQRALLAQIEEKKKTVPKLLTRSTLASKLDAKERKQEPTAPASRRRPGHSR